MEAGSGLDHGNRKSVLIINAFFQYRAEFFQIYPVDFGKSVFDRAVYVEQGSDLAAAVSERYHELGIGGAVAGDMTGELVHVLHPDASILLQSGSADAFAKADMHAGDLSLERTENQIALLRFQIKPDPVNFGQKFIEQGGGIGKNRDFIAFVFHHAAKLLI